MASGVGLVFPGQGSQSVGMGRGFYDAHLAVRKVYQEAGTILGYDVAALCFDGPPERLNLTEYTQPALLTDSIAAFRLLEPLGLRPLAAAGHRLDEYSVLVASGGSGVDSSESLGEKRS